jgi:hypothetical protein
MQGIPLKETPMDHSDLIGRIAGMAVTKLAGMDFAHGMYFRVIEIEGPGQLKTVRTNPGMTTMVRTFPADQIRR